VLPNFTKVFYNNNFLSLANNGLVAVFGFLSFIMLVRMLPQDIFGEWILFITLGNFVDMLRFGITRTAIIRFLSGADPDESKKLIGSNNLINLISTIFLAILTIAIYFIFKDSIDESGFSMFFIWYPLLSVLNLPFNNAQSIQQARMRFDTMLWLRMINVGSFMLFLTANLFFKYDIQTIIWAYLITNLVSSIVASILNWDGIKYSFNATKATNKVLLDFGKYTTGTLIGSNLLKSSDTFIIGISPFLGTMGVALYSIPLKLTEIIEIPLRSFTATAFPGMSKASIENNPSLVKKIFYTNSGGMTFVIFPLMLFSFIFAEEIVLILGGKDYVSTANIFRIFCVYGLFLPLDRFIGVALDSINKPRQNFFKVIYMTLSNIIGDLIVVFGLFFIFMNVPFFTFFTATQIELNALLAQEDILSILKTLEWVAIVTIVFTLIGILVGYHYLNKELDLRIRDIFKGGKDFLKENLRFLHKY
jgi:O-antigen/teichoic acid export membrane protein